MYNSIANTELNSYLVGKPMKVYEICDCIDSFCIWMEDHRGITTEFNDVLADITDGNGNTGRFCIAEDGREIDDILVLKVNSVEVTDNWEVLLKAELAITE